MEVNTDNLLVQLGFVFLVGVFFYLLFSSIFMWIIWFLGGGFVIYSRWFYRKGQGKTNIPNWDIEGNPNEMISNVVKKGVKNERLQKQQGL